MKNNKIQLPKFLKNRYNVWKATSYLQNEKNIKKLAKLGQKPKAMIISCCDSRVNVASIFGAKEGDFFIGIQQIKDKIKPNIQSLILRTQNNYNHLNEKTYNNTNWPYLSEETATYIRDCGIVHLLIDQPSVDKEFDGGKLLAHKAFWNYPNELDKKRTITELIGVPDEINDGIYLLNLSMANIENDASPSRPTIYKLF